MGSKDDGGYTPLTGTSTYNTNLQDMGNGYMGYKGGTNRFGETRSPITTLRDKNGNLSQRFTQGLGQSATTLRDIGNTKGDSILADAQRQSAQLGYRNSMNSLNRGYASSQAQARNNMAMRGGLGTGARERMNQSGSNNFMMAQQGVGNNLSNQQLGITQNDIRSKLGLLGGSAKYEQMNQEANINRLTTDINNQNKINQRIYEADMAAYGADQQAQAQYQASEGGK